MSRLLCATLAVAWMTTSVDNSQNDNVELCHYEMNTE
jgi:hypothetical protein